MMEYAQLPIGGHEQILFSSLEGNCKLFSGVKVRYKRWRGPSLDAVA